MSECIFFSHNIRTNNSAIGSRTIRTVDYSYPPGLFVASFLIRSLRMKFLHWLYISKFTRLRAVSWRQHGSRYASAINTVRRGRTSSHPANLIQYRRFEIHSACVRGLIVIRIRRGEEAAPLMNWSVRLHRSGALE